MKIKFIARFIWKLHLEHDVRYYNREGIWNDKEHEKYWSNKLLRWFHYWNGSDMPPGAGI